MMLLMASDIMNSISVTAISSNSCHQVAVIVFMLITIIITIASTTARSTCRALMPHQ